MLYEVITQFGQNLVSVLKLEPQLEQNLAIFLPPNLNIL